MSPKNVGHFWQPRVIKSILVYRWHEIIFPSKFMLPGGGVTSCRLILKFENGIFFNWLQV